MKTKMTEAINNINKKDTETLMLFVLSQLKQDPKYSTLSQLRFMVNNEDFLNILTYFGGLTVTFPTLQDMRLLVQGMSLYQRVNIEGEDYSKVLNSLSPEFTKKEIEEVYNTIVNTISKHYSISMQENL